MSPIWALIPSFMLAVLPPSTEPGLPQTTSRMRRAERMERPASSSDRNPNWTLVGSAQTCTTAAANLRPILAEEWDAVPRPRVTRLVSSSSSSSEAEVPGCCGCVRFFQPLPKILILVSKQSIKMSNTPCLSLAADRAEFSDPSHDTKQKNEYQQENILNGFSEGGGFGTFSLGIYSLPCRAARRHNRTINEKNRT